MHKIIAPGLLIFSLLNCVNAQSAVYKPSDRHDATSNKTESYISDGYFVGGTHEVTVAKLKDIRQSNPIKGKSAYERIVFDVETQSEKKEHLPYYQILSSPNEGRFVLSIWANVQYDFDAKKIQNAFKKSEHVKKVNVVPRVEEGLAIIELFVHPASQGKKVKFEVFQLTHPNRIILDMI
jgi:hypothetical protein